MVDSVSVPVESWLTGLSREVAVAIVGRSSIQHFDMMLPAWVNGSSVRRCNRLQCTKSVATTDKSSLLLAYLALSLAVNVATTTVEVGQPSSY